MDGRRRAAGDRAADRRGDEEHRSGGYGPRGQASTRRSRARECRVRLESGIHRRRNCCRGLPAPRSGRHRRIRRGRRRRHRGASHGDRRADRSLRRSVRRDGEARSERGARHADLVHQRDRERLRGDRGRRDDRRSRHRPRPANRTVVPARRDRLRQARASRRTRSRSSSSLRTRATTFSC